MKHTGLVADTRPLSVTNTDNRILASAVARSVMPAVLGLVDPSQKGFLAGRCGGDHTLDINTFFYEGVEKGIDRLLFLLDTAKAFDSVVLLLAATISYSPVTAGNKDTKRKRKRERDRQWEETQREKNRERRKIMREDK